MIHSCSEVITGRIVVDGCASVAVAEIDTGGSMGAAGEGVHAGDDVVWDR